MKFLTLIAAIIFPYTIFAQEYSIKNIPQELQKDANAVIRNREIVYTIISKSNSEFTEKIAITILNKAGSDVSTFEHHYSNSYENIKKVSGKIFDETGKGVKNIFDNDFKDYSAAAGYSIFEDSRVLYYEPAQKLPYTVEYQYTTKNTGILHLPIWYSYPAGKVSVEKTSLKVIVPNSLKLNYFEINIQKPVSIESDAKNTTYTWQLENLKAFDTELFSGNYDNYLSIIYLTLNNFEMLGFEGNMDSWENFGSWINKLCAGRNNLSATTRDEIAALTVGMTDNYQKAETIYKYMQQRSRYVSVQMGIGGWQPMFTADVHDLGYGDCKALSFYTKALLEAVGIESFYAIIRSGENAKSIEPEFPNPYFNHVILCVPIENDTVWLECTSKDSPFGFLGSFTDNRHALIITENGGKLAHTTNYKLEQNSKTSTAKVSITDNGNAKASITTTYSGLQFEDRNFLTIMGFDDQKKYLYENLQIKNFSINELNYSVYEDRIPTLTETMEINIEKYASVSSQRTFIPLNLLNNSETVFPKLENRRNDIVFNREFFNCDTIIFTIPDDYTIESFGSENNFETRFGTYNTTVLLEENTITYIRTRKFFAGTFEASYYNELVEFQKNIKNADKQKIVLKPAR